MIFFWTKYPGRYIPAFKSRIRYGLNTPRRHRPRHAYRQLGSAIESNDVLTYLVQSEAVQDFVYHPTRGKTRLAEAEERRTFLAQS